MKNLLLQKQPFILYCAIGVSGVCLDFGLYSFLVKSRLLGYQLANAAGYASGTFLSFFLNARFNFRVTDNIVLRLASFYGVAFLGWLASTGALYVLIGQWGLDPYLSKLLTLVLVVMLQYNGNRLLSFRKSAEQNIHST